MTTRRRLLGGIAAAAVALAARGADAQSLLLRGVGGTDAPPFVSSILAAGYFTVASSGTGAVTLVKQQNVASVVRNGTGSYTVTFASALANANYIVLAAGRGAGAVARNGLLQPSWFTGNGGTGAYGTASLDLMAALAGSPSAALDIDAGLFLVIDPTKVQADVLAAAFYTVSSGTPTIQKQTNMTAVVNKGTGIYEAQFTAALADANYSMFSSSRWTGTSTDIRFLEPASGQDCNPTGSLNKHTTTAFTHLAGESIDRFYNNTFDTSKGSLLARDSSQSGVGILAGVRFTISGGVCTIVKGYNVASVTYIAAGVYRVNFTSNLANTQYVPICAGKLPDSAGNDTATVAAVLCSGDTNANLAVSSVTVGSYRGNSAAEAATYDVLIVDAATYG